MIGLTLPSDPVLLLQLVVYILIGLSLLTLIIFLLIIRMSLRVGLTKQDIMNTVWAIGSLFVSVVRFLNDKRIISNDEYIRILALMTLIMRRPDLADKLMVYILQTPRILQV